MIEKLLALALAITPALPERPPKPCEFSKEFIERGLKRYPTVDNHTQKIFDEMYDSYGLEPNKVRLEKGCGFQAFIGKLEHIFLHDDLRPTANMIATRYVEYLDGVLDKKGLEKSLEWDVVCKDWPYNYNALADHISDEMIRAVAAHEVAHIYMHDSYFTKCHLNNGLSDVQVEARADDQMRDILTEQGDPIGPILIFYFWKVNEAESKYHEPAHTRLEKTINHFKNKDQIGDEFDWMLE